MLVNRTVRLDNAYATLDIIEDLPIAKDYANEENEWEKGIELAREDLKDMTSGEMWRESPSRIRSRPVKWCKRASSC